MPKSNSYISKVLVLLSLFALISCSVKRKVVSTEGSHYRFFSSPADGEKKLFISIILPNDDLGTPHKVLVNGEEVPFEKITNQAKVEVFISEFKQALNAEEQQQRELFLRLAQAEEINLSLLYPSEEFIYKNVPKQVSQHLEMRSAPR